MYVVVRLDTTFVLFIMCPHYVGLMKRFCGCRCFNHSSATSLGPFYGDYSLRGRLSHNKFNNSLGLEQSITSTTTLGYNGFKIGYPN
jgi:hypothetical protein